MRTRLAPGGIDQPIQRIIRENAYQLIWISCIGTAHSTFGRLVHHPHDVSSKVVREGAVLFGGPRTRRIGKRGQSECLGLLSQQPEIDRVPDARDRLRRGASSSHIRAQIESSDP